MAPIDCRSLSLSLALTLAIKFRRNVTGYDRGDAVEQCGVDKEANAKVARMNNVRRAGEDSGVGDSVIQRRKSGREPMEASHRRH